MQVKGKISIQNCQNMQNKICNTEDIQPKGNSAVLYCNLHIPNLFNFSRCIATVIECSPISMQNMLNIQQKMQTIQHIPNKSSQYIHWTLLWQCNICKILRCKMYCMCIFQINLVCRNVKICKLCIEISEYKLYCKCIFQIILFCQYKTYILMNAKYAS